MTELELQELKENIQAVYLRIAEAAHRAGRHPEDIQLVAATKMNSAERVQAAIQNGIRIAGENRVQELMDKYALHAYQNADLHFIGTL